MCASEFSASCHVGGCGVRGVASMEAPEQFRRWRLSLASRAIGRQAAAKGVAVLAARPRCGARTKRSGSVETCMQPAMANGRCKCHGGLTPRGDQWHVPQWCDDPEKNVRKAQTLEKRRKARKARLAAMTPEAREKSLRRAKALRPAPQAAREARKAERERNAEARALLTAPRRAPIEDSETLRLRAIVAKAERLLWLKQCEREGLFS